MNQTRFSVNNSLVILRQILFDRIKYVIFSLLKVLLMCFRSDAYSTMETVQYIFN